ncbi:Uncharacterised protein [Acinetobacter baumannii]|nr:Uncharacterised protein [Acinetobacter baumannii]
MAHRCKQVERAIDQGKCAEHDGHGQQSRLWHPEREGCKNQCQDTAQHKKPPILAQRTQCFVGVIRIGIGDGICVHAISPKDLYKIKNQTLMGQERGRYAPPLQRFQNNLDSFALTSSSQPFPQPPPPVFSLIFLSSAYRGSKSFLLP